MKPKPTTVQLPDLHLVVVRAERDREAEIKAAWQTLESKLPSLKGRKFYGVMSREESGPVYYAGLETADDDEVRSLGLPTFSIRAGSYVRVRILDWHQHTDQIGVIFDDLEKSFPIDPRRPSLEHYRSNSELDLLAPLREA
jgi:predicted transcriptional regulator YdeE